MKKLRELLSGLLATERPQPSPQAPAAETPALTEHVPVTPPLPNSPLPTCRFDPEVAIPAARCEAPRPYLSLVVVVYRMPDQAEKTLYSLGAAYQRGVSEDDYEVIVVENSSPAVLGEKRACQYGGNVRYFYREETLPTPVPAVNFGAGQARGSHICIMVDGARMLSPGVLSYTLAALRLDPQAQVAVPGYHLGPKLQQRSILEGYSEAVEAELLASIDWPADGYQLFEISCLSGTSGGGYFKPLGESNCFCVARDVWRELGGFDPGFTTTGGGQVNLDFYKRAVELPGALLVMLIGEGSFHQLHGGATTGIRGEDRTRAMDEHFNQYAALRGGPFKAPTRRPVFLGSPPDCAMRFMHHSTTGALQGLER